LGLGPAKRCEHRRCSRQPPTTRRRRQTTDDRRDRITASALTNFYTAPGRATVASRNSRAQPGIPPAGPTTLPLSTSRSQPSTLEPKKASTFIPKRCPPWATGPLRIRSSQMTRPLSRQQDDSGTRGDHCDEGLRICSSYCKASRDHHRTRRLVRLYLKFILSFCSRFISTITLRRRA